jgi:hypothetical protein
MEYVIVGLVCLIVGFIAGVVLTGLYGKKVVGQVKEELAELDAKKDAKLDKVIAKIEGLK